jgi:hypothetical protein
MGKVGRFGFAARFRHGEKKVGGLRVFSCSVLLLIMAGGLAGADTFKCKRPDGTIIFTNDPSQAPSDCLLERVKDLPPIGIIPDYTPPTASVPSEKRLVAPQTEIDDTKSFNALKSEAARLVEEFQSARRRAMHSSLVKDQLVAKRELTEIRVQKTMMLSELDQASLSAAEQQELEGLLSAITE